MFDGDAQPYAVLWSGGKDSCLALWRARQAGLRVSSLVNFIDEYSARVRFHGVRSTMIARQAQELKLDLIQVGTKPDCFADSFDAALHALKDRGHAGVIAGDIHLQDVRQWNEQRAAAAGLQCIEPLWHDEGLNILRSLVEARFRAVVTCCDETWQRILWPGREIDKAFIADVSRSSEFDVCGERGEYHSFVFDGPIFSNPVDWHTGEIRRSNGFCQIDLLSEFDSVKQRPLTRFDRAEN
jgi:uncharacterized protein (TIGR00290 family)